MKIVVDINHPAHVHYFKNFIRIMKERGHQILITASEKDVTFQLLGALKLEYVNLGSYGNNTVQKAINILSMDYKMLKAVKNFNPDILIGFGSIRAAHVSKLLNKPSIIFDDTEHAVLGQTLYRPFASQIITPSCYKKNMGKNHVRFDGFMELAALHPNYFSPDPSILADIGLTGNDRYIIVRFVSWQAIHDVGHSGLSMVTKIRAIKEFENFGHVFITSENRLPDEFDKYRISIAPEKMHDLLFYATLLYGESATMASECAVLGTHAIFCDFAGRGYTDEEENKYNLVYNYKFDEISQNKSIEKGIEILSDPKTNELGKIKRDRLLNDKIDVTMFMTWFVEYYPNSVDSMKNDPTILNKLKYKKENI